MGIEQTPLLGIFAGGAARRMGGTDKGALQIPGRNATIIEHQIRLATELNLDCVLLGARETWHERCPGVPVLQDSPQNVGPLGGLGALLQHAGHRPAITLACDMPFVDRALLQLLAHSSCTAPVLAPRDPKTGKWQPLFARYDSITVLPTLRKCLDEGLSSFQPLLHRIGAAEFALNAEQQKKLRDWDTPQDVQQDVQQDVHQDR